MLRIGLTIGLVYFSLAAAELSTISPIERAQQTLLKKNRAAAMHLLLESLNAVGTATARQRGKWIEALNSIDRVFLSDKGQKEFESALSVQFDNPDMALSQLREALAVEDGNVLVLESIARVQIAKGDCDGASLTLGKARAANPFAPDSALLELRTLLCQHNSEAFREKVKALPALEKSQEWWVVYAMAEDARLAKNFRKASELLSKVTEAAPKFPEAYLGLAKVAKDSGHEDLASSRRYVSLCKVMTARVRRQYNNEPRLCSSLKEIEDELALKNSEL